MVGQVLQLNTTYSKVQVESSPSRFVRSGPYGSAQPELQMRTERGSVEIEKKSPCNLDLNWIELIRPSAKLENCFDEIAQKGKEAAMAASAKFAREGNMYLDPDVNGVLQSASQVVLEDADQTYVMTWVPTIPLNIEFTPEELEFHYIKDRIFIDVKLGENEFDYQAGDVNVNLAQEGEVNVTYVGEPNYFPTSYQKFNKLV